MSFNDDWLFLADPGDALMDIPREMKLPSPRAESLTDYVIASSMGGFMHRPPGLEVVKYTPPPPGAPGVKAMLEDGWTMVDGDAVKTDAQPPGTPIIVPVEGDACGAVFVRTGPPGHSGIGHRRGDDAGGEAVLCPRLEWVDKSSRTGFGWVRERGRPGTSIRITAARIASGRYAERIPTNRKAKRERCKARRRLRR